MQYRISAHVSENDLTKAITALHNITDSVVVRQLSNAKNTSQETTVSDKENGDLSITHGHNSRNSYRRQNGKFATDIVVDIINECGLTPFTTDMVARKALRRGIKRPNVYRATCILIEAGKLKRLKRGMFQRTPQSVGGKLALSSQVISDLRSEDIVNETSTAVSN